MRCEIHTSTRCLSSSASLSSSSRSISIFVEEPRCFRFLEGISGLTVVVLRAPSTFEGVRITEGEVMGGEGRAPIRRLGVRTGRASLGAIPSATKTSVELGQHPDHDAHQEHTNQPIFRYLNTTFPASFLPTALRKSGVSASSLSSPDLSMHPLAKTSTKV
jgi:hypothetical protein